MRRWLFNLFAAGSLALCVLMIAAWFLRTSGIDEWSWIRESRPLLVDASMAYHWETWELTFGGGTLCISHDSAFRGNSPEAKPSLSVVNRFRRDVRLPGPPPPIIPWRPRTAWSTKIYFLCEILALPRHARLGTMLNFSTKRRDSRFGLWQPSLPYCPCIGKFAIDGDWPLRNAPIAGCARSVAMIFEPHPGGVPNAVARPGRFGSGRGTSISSGKKRPEASLRALEEFEFETNGLSLRELEPSACAALTVFLTFLHSAVAGHEPGVSQGGFQGGIIFQ
jgi:hypothetical protein